MEENHSGGNIIMYKTEDSQVKVDVRFYEDSIWLTLDQMAELFERDKSTVSRHIKKFFSECELKRESVVAKFATTAADGKTYQVDYYNLDVIISVGYRVKSLRGTQFRQWASKQLNEYIRKGFTLDDERLKNLGGGGYWKELLERIQDIRASGKVFYRQILDLYATSIDYDPKADVSIDFFKKVQKKIPHTVIAKNYLDEKELRAMGQIVSGYLDFAERQAEREQIMTMRDWADHLDRILVMSGEQLLEDTKVK